MEREHGANVATAVIDRMQPRMKNPVMFFPAAGAAVQALMSAVHDGGVPRKTLDLVHLRVSQINGCSACVEGGSCSAQKENETPERLFAVAAWRHAPYFSDAERAALALGEAATRLADRTGDAVPDAIWNEAARHYDEKALAALVLWIALSNFFNRLNESTGQVAGTWG